MFTYPKPSDTDCVVYSFSVTPHNIVGAGEITTEVYSGGHRKVSVCKLVAQRVQCGYSSSPDGKITNAICWLVS